MSSRHSLNLEMTLAVLAAFLVTGAASAQNGAPTPGAAKDSHQRDESKTAASSEQNPAMKPVNEKILPLLNNGYELLSKGQYDKATQVLEKAVKADGESISARRYLAFAQVRNGDNLKALSNLQALSRLVTPGALDWYVFGEAYMGAGGLQHAKSCFNQALTFSPDYAAARGGLVKSQIRLKEFDEALSTVQDGINKTRDPQIRRYFSALYQNAAAQKEAARRALMTSPVPESSTTATQEETGPVLIKPSNDS
ncbi:MAG: tetratricopeptide repeat protein [Candidatus Obscuribacter sp.]|nr:tetratricopeptide repeat protein [Candidatus Obscuribacter sp.]